MKPVLTLAGEWERIAPVVVENFGEAPARVRGEWRALYYLGAKAMLNLLTDGADIEALRAECREYGEERKRGGT
jgi:hypothetical protein